MGAQRLRRSASPPRTARGLAYQLGYGAGTAAREVHDRLYFNANEMRARKEAQQRLRCAHVPPVCPYTFAVEQLKTN